MHSAVWIPTILCCLLLPGFSVLVGPVDFSAHLLSSQHACIPNHGLSVFKGIGSGFSPVHFQRPKTQRVSCYALLRGWLLLVLPSRCLCLGTAFCLTLNPHLGPLTLGCVVPLSVVRLTPTYPSAGVYEVTAFEV